MSEAARLYRRANGGLARHRHAGGMRRAGVPAEELTELPTAL